MTDQDSFEHFLKKVYEILHLHFRHYLPLGKPEPMHYRDALYQLYKIYDNGILEEISKEPILDEEVKQLDLLAGLFSENTDSVAEHFGGTLFDQQELKKP